MCFKDDDHGELAGFYNQVVPASISQKSTHDVAYSIQATEKSHENYWCPNAQENPMKEYINRHYD